jgi:hypothetical protein
MEKCLTHINAAPKMTIYSLLFNPLPFYLHTHTHGTVLVLCVFGGARTRRAYSIYFCSERDSLFTATFWRVPAAAVKKDQKKAARVCFDNSITKMRYILPRRADLVQKLSTNNNMGFAKIR